MSCYSIAFGFVLFAGICVVCNCQGSVREKPTAIIAVHVRRRAAARKYWEPWQLNSNICPPSICPPADESGGRVRPRGTGDSVFFQGDIILSKLYERYIWGAKRAKRATMRLKNHLWKDGVVPYVIDQSISPLAKTFARKAIRHIEQRTCIKFRKKRTKDKDYIKYISDPGCWSNVGKKGGMQLVSLGRGCENLGVAVHETVHALGMWHEQSRADRDKYVKILTKNISPKYLPDFKIINRKISTSRGSPYDYESLMHYSRYAFTRNGEETIKVIGVGKKLGLKIGQRVGLSTIDIAQLRDMYRCNKKEDTNATECPKGWAKFQTRCYQFNDHPKVQYAAALRSCQKNNANLVSIESKSEQKFLTKYLNKHHKYTHIWRTGGKRMNNTFVWDKGDGKKGKKMKFTNWGPGEPSTYTSMALVRNRTTSMFSWQGVWVGSVRQLPNYMYPFICEKRAKRKCISGKNKDGRDYRGKLDHTRDGYTCQKWTSQYPHQHKLKPADKDDPDGLGDHNYCRNPKGKRRSRPWCYTAKSKKEWQFCDITICSSKDNNNTSNNKMKNQKKGNKGPGAKTSPKPKKPKPTTPTKPRRRRPTKKPAKPSKPPGRVLPSSPSRRSKPTTSRTQKPNRRQKPNSRSINPSKRRTPSQSSKTSHRRRQSSRGSRNSGRSKTTTGRRRRRPYKS